MMGKTRGAADARRRGCAPLARAGSPAWRAVLALAWFAVLVGVRYRPYDESGLLSLDVSYALIFMGMGAAAARVLFVWPSQRPARFGAAFWFAAAVATTLAVAVASWRYVISDALYQPVLALLGWVAAPYVSLIAAGDALLVLDVVVGPVSFVAAGYLCARWALHAVAGVSDEDGGAHRAPLPMQPLGAASALAFALGVLRGPAWVWCLPHIPLQITAPAASGDSAFSSFPIVDYRADAEWALWGQGPVFTVAACALATLLAAAFVSVAVAMACGPRGAGAESRAAADAMTGSVEAGHNSDGVAPVEGGDAEPAAAGPVEAVLATLILSCAAGSVCFSVLTQIVNVRAVTDGASIALCALWVGLLAGSLLIARATARRGRASAASVVVAPHRHAGSSEAAGASTVPAGPHGLIGFTGSSDDPAAGTARDPRCASRDVALERLGLTARERECLGRALDGGTSEQVAAELGIKAPTVRAYLQRAYRKLGVSTLAGARGALVAHEAEVVGDGVSAPYGGVAGADAGRGTGEAVACRAASAARGATVEPALADPGVIAEPAPTARDATGIGGEPLPAASAIHGSSTTKGPHFAFNRPSQFLAPAALAALSCLLAAALLPSRGEIAWGAGLPAVYAFVISCLLIVPVCGVLWVSGARVVSARSLAPVVLDGTGWRPRARRAAMFADSLAIALSGCALGFFRFGGVSFDGAPIIRWIGGDQAAQMVALLVLVPVAGACAVRAALRTERLLGERLVAVALAVGVVCGLVLLSFDAHGSGREASAALSVIAGTLAFLMDALGEGGGGAASGTGVAVSRPSDPAFARPRPVALIGPYALPAAAAFALVFAICWEEVWREQASLAFAAPLAPFSAAVLAGAIILLRPRRRAGARALVVTSVAVIATAALLGMPFTALFAMAALAGAILVFLHARSLEVDVRVILGAALSAAAGCAGSVRAVNMFGDIAYRAYTESLYSPYTRAAVTPAAGVGDERAVMLAAGMLTVGVLEVVAIVLIALAARDARSDLAAQRILGAPVFDDSRVRSYLVGRGLNATQVDVIVRTARGESAAMISRACYLAPGTVSSARNAAYRMLRVHSRAQLAALLKRDAGL